jgi:hypothetical protein
MNFLDQIYQDKEEAKATLTNVLNQKAFSLLDTYADNSEVEVVTFEDEEVANEEFELEGVELTEEQLNEFEGLNYTIGGKVDKDHVYHVHRQSRTANGPEWEHHERDVYHSLADAKKVAANMGGKFTKTKITRHARTKLAGPVGKLPEGVEELDEGLGSLAGLSKHLIKTVTKDPYSGRKAGEHSDVVTHPIKNKSAHREVLNKALDDGHVPVVYVNGKIHSAGHSTGSSYGRPEYHIHDADKQKEQKETKYPKAYKSGGKYIYPPSHQISNPRYKKGDALDQLTPGHEASFYKENKVEVKVIHPDKERLAKMKARGDNRPPMQANTVKMTPDEKAKKGYSYSDSKTVSHTPEGNMKAIKDAAALKLATQKLGTSGSSANKKAMELHAELGKHLAAGKHTEAIRAANALSDHVRSQGLETHADKIKDYASTLKDLKNNWGNKEYAHQKLAKMRGEKTNEAEELVDALETMLTEMLDINEATTVDNTATALHTVLINQHAKTPGHGLDKLANSVRSSVSKATSPLDLHARHAAAVKKIEAHYTEHNLGKPALQGAKSWLPKANEEVDEDAEQIDELSKKTLKSYIKKAKADFKAKTSYDDHDGYDFAPGVSPQKMMKRSETIDAAKAQVKK